MNMVTFLVLLRCVRRCSFSYLNYKIFPPVLARFAARFCAYPFCMLICCKSSYLENCLIVLYLSFFFIPAPGNRPRDNKMTNELTMYANRK